MPLVLTRKVGEGIILYDADDCEVGRVTIGENSRPSHTKLCIDAPLSVKVKRTEHEFGGFCDLCDRQGTEDNPVVRSIVSGIETFHCAQGHEAKF